MSAGNEPRDTGSIDRRRALQLATMTLASAPVLIACGNESNSSSKGSKGPEKTTTSPAPSTMPGVIAQTTEIPAGSAKIIPAEKIVITNDPKGTFQGFSYLCTHQGCPVTSVEGETIKCACHGSEFSARDGSVLKGPATKALEQIDLQVQGTDIRRA